ncbi:MAG: S16 family serine protease, partial [Candidatus Promineifilaceae bacterium]
IRKLAVRIASGEEGPFNVSAEEVETIMGPEKFTYGMVEENDEVGVVTGLAVNMFGGDTLPIEVSLSEGSGRITLTGSLGDVMRESAQAALTYARANARLLDLEPGIFDKINVHIHVPDGATPKDGPSAGIGMATAVISALTRRPVRNDVAMTGEITLRGKVLPIGGLKSKTIAAHRAGVTTVLLPKDNAKEIPELPERVRQDLQLIPVSHLEEVLEIALLEPSGPPIKLSEESEKRQEVIIPPVQVGGVEGILHVSGD